MSPNNFDPLDVEKTIVKTDGRGDYSLNPGDQLGQYRVLRLLGRGGMGEVYEVEHQVLRKRYAFKILPPAFASQSGALERFRREAQVMANLEHPNIIRVDEFGEMGGKYWLRMELAEGIETGNLKLEIEGTSRRVVSLQELAGAPGGKLPQELLLPILKQVLIGLDYAHQHGAIHRDLKPANILLASSRITNPESPATESLVAKISDFGLVKLVGEEWVRSQAQVSVQRSLSMGDEQTVGRQDEGTSTQSLVGTYDYMSPEQRDGQEVDARSDLYAVGVIAYRLLTGKKLMGRAKAASALVKGLSSKWDAFIDFCLEEDPAKRPQTASLALLKLKEISVFGPEPTLSQRQSVEIQKGSGLKLRVRAEDAKSQPESKREAKVAVPEIPTVGSVDVTPSAVLANIHTDRRKALEAVELKKKKEEQSKALGLNTMLGCVMQCALGWVLAGWVGGKISSLIWRLSLDWEVEKGLWVAWLLAGGIGGMITENALTRIVPDSARRSWVTVAWATGLMIAAFLYIDMNVIPFMSVVAIMAGALLGGLGVGLYIYDGMEYFSAAKVAMISVSWSLAFAVGELGRLFIGLGFDGGFCLAWGIGSLLGGVATVLLLVKKHSISSVGN